MQAKGMPPSDAAFKEIVAERALTVLGSLRPTFFRKREKALAIIAGFLNARAIWHKRHDKFGKPSRRARASRSASPTEPGEAIAQLIPSLVDHDRWAGLLIQWT
jgi:hypothetical protein